MSPEERRPFPLVPRWRLTGLPFGEQPSVRRGPGSDVAGSREYVPGDPISSIDWYASARLSSARIRSTSSDRWAAARMAGSRSNQMRSWRERACIDTLL